MQAMLQMSKIDIEKLRQARGAGKKLIRLSHLEYYAWSILDLWIFSP